MFQEDLSATTSLQHGYTSLLANPIRYPMGEQEEESTEENAAVEVSVRVEYSKKRRAAATTNEGKPRVQKGLKDALYFVRWKLEKVAKTEINKG
jgi:hypothetical protein